MKILGMDSSGLVASAAVLVDDTVVSEFTVNNKKTHSQTLLPMIDQVIKMSGIEKGELDAVAVAAGPGSFTGLRIGSSTAKGIAYVLGKPVIAVPTLEGLAYRLAGTEGLVCPMMDARRNQVYTGLYQLDEGRLTVCIPQEAADIMEILSAVNETGKRVIFLGDGVSVQEETIRREVKVSYTFAPAHLNRQSAAAIAVLGAAYYSEGRIEDAMTHRPVYLRKSQAERERSEKRKEGIG
ncbi:MAG: tRNA (adenosine(37)-N6)-threonylcarbamoyltransferase complex dimerization subunit type 1 TsaB [Lachnospiraceae bacterium]|nr:tRNA (adenosine(37)-N6)-threonylcarbamoyltransferase complex dimerization subunit type 1 TsaB [Lachnospiraceae bacterium]